MCVRVCSRARVSVCGGGGGTQAIESQRARGWRTTWSPREKLEPPPTPPRGRVEPGPELSRKMEGLRGGVAGEGVHRAVRLRLPAQAPPRVSSEVAISTAA